jgi:hypothetical protein
MAVASAAARACGKPRSAFPRRCATTPNAGRSSSSCRSARLRTPSGPTRTCSPGHGPLDQESPSSTATRSAPISPALAGRLRRMGTGAPLSASLGRHRHCRRRRLLELRSGALAAGLNSARRVCAAWAARRSGSSTAPTTVVLPRQSELMFDAFKAAGGPRPPVALPGAQTRLLDARL